MLMVVKGGRTSRTVRRGGQDPTVAAAMTVAARDRGRWRDREGSLVARESSIDSRGHEAALTPMTVAARPMRTLSLATRRDTVVLAGRRPHGGVASAAACPRR